MRLAFEPILFEMKFCASLVQDVIRPACELRLFFSVVPSSNVTETSPRVLSEDLIVCATA